MKALRVVGPLLSLLMLTIAARIPLSAQDPATGGVNVTTWQQDDPAFCTANCVYRTGENLKESALKPTLSAYNFGQLCNYTVDGQIQDLGGALARGCA